MILSEPHDLMPPKLFSQLLGETITKLLDAINELGPIREVVRRFIRSKRTAPLDEIVTYYNLPLYNLRFLVYNPHKYGETLETNMFLYELAQDAPIDLTPEQVKEANALAKEIWAIEFPTMPTLTEDQEDEFVEM